MTDAPSGCTSDSVFAVGPGSAAGGAGYVILCRFCQDFEFFKYCFFHRIAKKEHLRDKTNGKKLIMLPVTNYKNPDGRPGNPDVCLLSTIADIRE